MGTEAQAEPIFSRYGLGDVHRISDSEQQLYAAFGLLKGSMGQLFSPGVVLRGLKAMAAGHFMGKPVGNTLRMSGVFLLHNDQVVKSFRHKSVADKPDYLSLARLPREGQVEETGT